MSKRYIVTGGGISSSNTDSRTAAIARVISDEIGSEPLSRRTIDGIIHLAADSLGFGKYVETDKVFNNLVNSGFLEVVGG